MKRKKEGQKKRENFSIGLVEGFKCEPGKAQSYRWDAKVPGLGIRATAAGAKSYIFNSRLRGRSLRITIGDTKHWTLSAAQAEARRLATLLDAGIDPHQAKAAQAAQDEAERLEAAAVEKREAMLVREAWDAYIAHQKSRMALPHIERGKKWGERHLLDHERLVQPGGQPRKRSPKLTLPGPLVPLLGMRLKDVTPVALQAWVTAEAETRPNAARQAYEAFQTFWRWCAKTAPYTGIVDSAVIDDEDVRDFVPARGVKKKDALEPEQLAAWFEAVRAIANPVISAYLQALLLTGARKNELLGLKWDNVDFRWRKLTIHDKVAKEGYRIIPLTPYVAKLIAALPRRNQWVFSSPGAASGRLQEPTIAHSQACAVAGLDLSLHGLRRSFATLSEYEERPQGAIAQIMGHAPSAIAEKHYKRRPLGLLRLHHVGLEKWILGEAGIEQPAAADGALSLVSSVK